MTTITPAATLSILDTNLSPDPNPVPFGGVAVKCPTGALLQDVVLPAASSNVALTFPVGVSTAAVLAICAVTCADLVVKLSGTSHTVPLGQTFLLYGVAASAVSVSSVLGGKIAYAAGG